MEILPRSETSMVSGGLSGQGAANDEITVGAAMVRMAATNAFGNPAIDAVVAAAGVGGMIGGAAANWIMANF